MILDKAILTAPEAASYMGISLKTLYNLTHKKAIPHYKPTGKLLYFRRDDLNDFLLSKRIMAKEEQRVIIDSKISK